MRKITNFNHLVAMVAVFTTVMMVSCVKDVVVDSNFHGTSSEKICFGAELAVTEDEITRGGAESNRLGNHILKSGDMEFPVGVYQQNGINSGAESETRGSVVNSKDGITQFNVWATFHKSETESMSYFDNVAYENTSGLFNPVDASDEYYWPGSGNVTFVAVANAPTSGFVANKNSAGTAVESFTYTVPADPTAQPDVMLAKSTVPGNTNSSVPLKFDHIMSAVNVKIGSVVKGEIRSITFKNVYTTGTYLVDQGVWVVDKTKVGDFTVKMEGGKFVSTGNEASGTSVNTDDAVFMMIPQNPGDNAEMVIEFYDTTTQTLYSGATALRGSIAGDNWDKRKTTNYMLSIDESFTLTIEPVGKKLDAHYVIGYANITVDFGNDTKNWTITATTSDGSEVTILPEDEVNVIAKQGFWTDYEVDANGNKIADTSEATGRNGYKTARGKTTWSSSGNVTNKLFYIFIPENISEKDREIRLILSTGDSSASTTKVLLQKYPNWTAGGFGWEVVDDEEEGEYGFKFSRKRTFIFPYKLGNKNALIAPAHYTKDEATAIATTIVNSFNASSFVTTEFYTQDWVTTRMYVQVDYTKLNNITGASSTTDGFNNTLALYDLGGIVTTGALEVALENTKKTESGHEGEKMFRNPVSGDDIPSSAQNVDVTLDDDGNSQFFEDVKGAITYILKKNRYYFQKKLDSGGNSTAYYAYFKRDDIKWYFPASGQFDYFNPNPNITNDVPYNYWSSTAVDGNMYAFRGNGEQEERTEELRVIAVRKDENNVYNNATATVDNTSMAGGDNGEAQWVD